jgi:hypothetical protein
MLSPFAKRSLKLLLGVKLKRPAKFGAFGVGSTTANYGLYFPTGAPILILSRIFSRLVLDTLPLNTDTNWGGI